MVKKKNVVLTILISFLFCCAFFIFSSPVKTIETYAAESVGKINSQNCLTDYDMDTSLYKVLNKLAQHITNGDRGTIRDFDTDVFNYTSHDSSYYNPSTSYGNEILTDLQNGILNLSTGTYAKYDCLKNSSNFSIKHIGGLNSLNLNNIHTLVLDGNSLTTISASDLSSLVNLTNLSIKANKLKTFTLSVDITGLNELDLSNNQLKKINLARLSETVSGVGPKVNLACNEFESLENIIFSPIIKLSKLDIAFNKITDLTEESIATLNSNLSGDSTANVLIQGTTNFSNLYAGDSITIYGSSEIENFNVKFFYNEESSFYREVESNLICSTSCEKSIETIYVPAGKIKVGFYSNDSLITKEAFPHLNDAVVNKLIAENENGKYSVPIKDVSYKGYSEGKEINKLNQQTDITVILSVKDIEKIPNKEDILSSNGVNYFYYTNSQNNTNSNTIEVKSNGKYTYNAYLTFDGIESSRVRIQIVRQDFKGVTWGIIVIVIIFVIFGAAFFVFKWFRNGAQVAPLSDKEIYRLNKRRGTLTEKSDDDFIASLDAPRHSTRVSDQNFNDDSLNDNLNSYDNYDDIKPTNDFPEDINSN